MKTGKRILALLLVLSLVLTVLVMPIHANAGEEGSAVMTENVLLSDDFSGDLSQWNTELAAITDGKLQLGTVGGGTVNAQATPIAGTDWTNYILEFDADFGGNPYRGISFRRQDNGDDYFWWFGDGNTNIKVVKRISGAWTEISDVKPSVALSGMHHFKLEVNGAEIKTYVDDVLYNTGSDEAFTTGGIQFFVNYDAAWIDNVTITSLVEDDGDTDSTDTLLEEDFSGDLSQWNSELAAITDGKLQLGTVGGGTVNALATPIVGSDWTNYILEFDADFGGNPYRGISFRRQDNGDDYFWWFGDGNTNIKVVKRVGGVWTDISDIKPAEALTGTHHFKLEVNGSEIKTYVDDVLYNTGSDEAFTTGGILFFVNYDAAWFDNVTVTAIEEEGGEGGTTEPTGTLLEDDFSADLSQWNSEQATVTEDDRLQLGTVGGGTVNALATPIAGTDWTNYTLEFDADFGGNPYRGISFRRQDNGDDYFWWFGDGNTNIKIVKRVGGAWTDISDVRTTEALSGSHHFKLVVNGSEFKAYVDDVLYNTGSDEAFTTGGFLFFVNYDAAWFDNVTVTAIEEEGGEEGGEGETPQPETPDFTDDFSGDLSNWTGALTAITDDDRLQLGTVGGGTADAYATPVVGSGWTNYTLEFDADFGGQSYRGISFRRQDNGDDYFWWFGDGNTNIKIVKRVGGVWTDISDIKPAEALTGTHHFKLVVNGSEFKAYVDDVLYNTGSDAEFTTGGFQFFVAYDAAWFDNVTVSAVAEDETPGGEGGEGETPQPETPDFTDEFSGDLSQWVSQTAVITDGRLQLGTVGGGNGDAWATPTVGSGWTDYVLEFDADFNGHPYRGVSFRRQANGDDYFLWFGDGATNIKIVKRVNSVWTDISNSQPGTGMTGTHHFKLVVQGSEFQAYVDDTLFVTGNDESFKTGGVLLFVGYDAAWFDNVVVREVTEDDVDTGAGEESDVPEFKDNFSGDLSGWIKDKASISGGWLQLGTVGGGTANAYAAPSVGSSWTDYVIEFDADFNGQPYRGVSFRRQDNGDDYLWWFGDGVSNIQIVKRVGGSWEPIGNVQPGMNLTGTHHFKVVVKGNTFTTFMDGEIYNTATDSELTKGGFLFLVTYDAAWFDNVVVRPYQAGDEYGTMANKDLWPEARIDETFVVEPEKWDGQMYEVSQGRLQLGKTGGGNLEAYYGPQGGYGWTDYVVEFDADFDSQYYRGISFRRQQTGGDYLWWFGDGGLGTLIMKRTATGWEAASDVQPAKALSGTHRLKLVVSGNKFLTFVDGVLCNTGYDETYKTGGIQFFVNYGVAWIDNVVVRAVEPSDLETGIDTENAIPDLHEDFEDELTDWNVENGVQEDGKLRLGAVGGGELYAYAAPLVGKNWTDYVLTVDFNFGGQPYRGISFRRQENGDDYLLWFGDSNIGAQIVKRVNGGWEPISESYYDMKLGGGEHRIKLEVVGSEFKVSVDGAPILTAYDEELTKGGILFFVNYEAAWIDNVSVTVPGEETTQVVPDSYDDDPFDVDGWQYEETPLEHVPVNGGGMHAGLIAALAAAGVVLAAVVIILVVVAKKKKEKQ